MSDFIGTGEFERTMETLNEKIDSGFAGVHKRFDHLEPEVVEHAKKIAVLEFQAAQAFKTASAASAEVQSSKSAVSNRAALFGSGAAGIVWGLFEFGKALKHYFTGP